MAIDSAMSSDDIDALCAPEPFRVNKTFYSIEWPAHTPVAPATMGVPYKFSFLASMTDVTEYVIEREAFKAMAQRHGLQCIQDYNLATSYRPTPKLTLTEEELDVVRLYRTYLFQRAVVGGSAPR
jgi:hypothetical protein